MGRQTANQNQHHQKSTETCPNESYGPGPIIQNHQNPEQDENVQCPSAHDHKPPRPLGPSYPRAATRTIDGLSNGTKAPYATHLFDPAEPITAFWTPCDPGTHKPACSDRAAEPQPPGPACRRSRGAADLRRRPKTESAAAVGSGERLCIFCGSPARSPVLKLRHANSKHPGASTCPWKWIAPEGR
jgi:hypothetical protein